MSYITSEEYIAAIGGYSFLEKAAKKLAEDYRDKFVGGKYASLEDIDIEGDEITGEIQLSFEVMYCGCCPGEYESYTLPISYLWDDDWVGREKEKRAEALRQREKRKAEEKAKQDKEREERRYQGYLKMKEEYESK